MSCATCTTFRLYWWSSCSTMWAPSWTSEQTKGIGSSLKRSLNLYLEIVFSWSYCSREKMNFHFIKYFLLREEIFVKTAFLKKKNKVPYLILSLISNYLCKYDICDFIRLLRIEYPISNQSSQFSRAAFWLAECAWRYYDLIGRCKIV